MSFPQPNIQLAQDFAKSVQGVAEYVTDSHEEVAFNRHELLDSFIEIEKIVVGKNTADTIAKAIEASFDSAVESPDIDSSGFDMASALKIKKYFNIVNLSMSYTYDVSEWFNKSTSQTEMLKHLVLEQMPGQPQGQVQVVYKEKGFWARLADSLGLGNDAEITTKQETMDFLTAKIKQIQNAEDMWSMLLDEYEEFSDNYIDFGKKPTALEIRTFQRHLHKAERTILAVLGKGLRLEMQETAKDLNALVQSMSSTAQSIIAPPVNPMLPALPGNGQVHR